METRNQIEKMILEKAMKEDAFRKNLLEDPKAAIEAELELKLPEGIRIEVLEETQDSFYLVLPAQVVYQKEDEQNETELNQVAGGLE